MIVTALAPWYGSKRGLAPEIVRQLGPHSCYWEPFCGSMAVLLAKPKACMETVNDLHGALINLARVVKHDRWGPWFYRQCRRTEFHEGLFAEADEELNRINRQADPISPIVGEPNALWAYHFFVFSWFGRNGVVGSEGGVNFCVRYTSNGGQPAKRWESTVSSIPAWRERLRGVTMLCRDGLEICERIEDKDGTVLYADPPYLAKGERYTHDFTEKDHERLALALRCLTKTRCVVSYYEHPLLSDLYPGWTKLSKPMPKAMASQGMRDKKGAKSAPEVLLINGPAIGGAAPCAPPEVIPETTVTNDDLFTGLE